MLWRSRTHHAVRMYTTTILPLARRDAAGTTDFGISFAEKDSGATDEPLQHAAVSYATSSVAENIDKAAAHLRAGELVAFPTETVYGLGASALSADAVLKIYAAKARPADNPLIVHISDLSMLRRVVPHGYVLNQVCAALAQTFWPGPLTLLFPVGGDAAPAVPSVVTCGQPTVGVRIPAHPVARALIAAADTPVAAPSANASGRPSPTTAQHVLDDLGPRGVLRYILDGGACSVGVESTVIDAVSTSDEVRILRPGGVTAEHVARVLAARNLLADTPSAAPGARRIRVYGRDFSSAQEEQAPTTPGMKYRHYSPDARVILMRAAAHGESLAAVLAECAAERENACIGLMCAHDSPLMRIVEGIDRGLAECSGDGRLSPVRQVHLGGHALQLCVYSLGSRASPETAAQRLFDGLRTLDSLVPWTGMRRACDVILVEAVGEDGVGFAVMNRLRKAASATVTVSN